MAAKKENLPLTIDENQNTTGTISYANEVIAVIAGAAATEVEGIAGMCGNGGFGFGKNKSITKGVKVELGSEEVAVDICLAVDYQTSIQKAAYNVQENVRKAIESMTGLHVVRVDVHVQSVRFEKEKLNAATIPSLNEKNMSKEPETVTMQFDGQPTPAEAHEPSVEFVPKEAAEEQAEEKPQSEAQNETQESVQE